MFQEFNAKINQLSNESDYRKSLDIAIDAANELLRILDPTRSDLRYGEDALDEAIPVSQFPNHKIENWFAEHPYFTGDKVALRLYSSDTVDVKFYWLSDSATKARISAGVMLTPNWEDSELTRNENYKVGIDFFLTSNTRSLLVAVSNNGNLRIIEFSDKLSHTQIEILKKLKGSLSLQLKEQMHKTLWDALALSEVNKKFYAGIAEQFNILLNHLVADGRDKEDSKLFASRLLGRLLFIWFLRRKNIIEEQHGYFELAGNDATKYYETKLKKLFFSTLNKPVDERQGGDERTPYLNGGLFEAHDNDWAGQIVVFPIGFFNGLFEHLEKYNFTTDESSPEYEQVAIDPEMLGRVFESLLATQVMETGEQARKAKGAFYTPREIVSYMCRESLRQYLYGKLNNESWHDGVDKLLDVTDSEWEINHSNSKRNLWGEANRNIVPLRVIGALNELTVLDPACGSGAFPMGMLQLILKTYERLDSTYDPYKKKLQIIQNNIFGVDIEPMAVEISRLRAWLSLVVDDGNDNRVEPLPNLDFKFLCANSLIPLEEQTGIFADAGLHEKLTDFRVKFFNARKPEMKEKWKKEYHRLTAGGQATLGGDRRDEQLKSFDPFKNSRNSEFFNADYMFGIHSFDIVIGNPPYGARVSISDKKVIQTVYKSARTIPGGQKGSLDTFSVFIEQGVDVLSKGGVLSYIVPLTITSGDSMTGIHSILLANCREIRISSYCDRPVQIFKNAHKKLSIISLTKSETPVEQILMTKMNRLKSNAELKDLLDSLKFTPVSKDLFLHGRLPKISLEIESNILRKIFSLENSRIRDITKRTGEKLYYRSAGGMYFNVVTTYPNDLSSEKSLTLCPELVNPVAAVLSSTLFWWYQQVFTDGFNLKAYEIESFPIARSIVESPDIQTRLSRIYKEYAEDIEKNVNIRESNSYKNATSFKEYKIRRSMRLINEIDNQICSAYGLSDDEVNFIINYERDFRTNESYAEGG
ncbi:MAG: DNA methyltransferase [Candidatus Saccharimonas sp.]